MSSVIVLTSRAPRLFEIYPGPRLIEKSSAKLSTFRAGGCDMQRYANFACDDAAISSMPMTKHVRR
jgi:hypothetical protein